MPEEERTGIEEDTQKDKYLSFALGQEVYGIEIKVVIEIIGIQTITSVPEVPEYVMGIINLRGKIIPVVDMRLRFHREFREYNDRTCIIVIEANDLLIGLIVDSVAEVVNIPADNVVPPPKLKASQNKYILGIGKTGDAVTLLLDWNKLFSDQDEDILGNITAN